MPGRMKPQTVNLLGWFVAMCGFALVMIQLIMRSKRASRAGMHRLGTLTIPIDGWTMSHFMMYTTVGYTCYETIWPFALFGVGFEIVEEITGMFNRQAQPGTKTDWFGRMSDPLVNTAGLLVGQALGKRFNKDMHTKKTWEHLTETSLFMTNFAVLWFMISEADRYWGLRRQVVATLAERKRTLENTLGEIIEHLDELSPVS